MTQLNSILTFAGLATAAIGKARLLEDIGKRDEADALYKKILDSCKNGFTRSASDLFYVAQVMWATEYSKMPMTL